MHLVVFSGVYDNEEANSRLAEAALLKVGDPVELWRESHSKLDPSAVMVLSKRGCL